MKIGSPRELALAGTLAVGLAGGLAPDSADAGIIKVNATYGMPTNPQQVILQMKALREELGGVLESAPTGGGFGGFTISVTDQTGAHIPLTDSQIFSTDSPTFTHTFADTGVANGYEWLILGAGGDIKDPNLFQDGEVEIARAILDLGIPVGSVSIGVGGGEGTFRDQLNRIIDVNAVEYTVTDASQEIPEPPMAALFGAGLAVGALAGMRRRKEGKEDEGATGVEGTVGEVA